MKRMWLFLLIAVSAPVRAEMAPMEKATACFKSLSPYTRGHGRLTPSDQLLVPVASGFYLLAGSQGYFYLFKEGELQGKNDFNFEIDGHRTRLQISVQGQFETLTAPIRFLSGQSKKSKLLSPADCAGRDSNGAPPAATLCKVGEDEIAGVVYGELRRRAETLKKSRGIKKLSKKARSKNFEPCQGLDAEITSRLKI